MHTKVGTVVIGELGHELMRAVVGVLDPRGGTMSSLSLWSSLAYYSMAGGL